MDAPARNWIKRHATALYFVITYLISWGVMVPVALSARGLWEIQIDPAWYYLASFGPLLSAIIVTTLAEGAQAMRKLLAGLLKWRVGIGYLFFSLFAPVIFFAIAVAVQLVISGEKPNLLLLREVDYLPQVGIPGAIGVWLLTYGLGEEVGWRGFALPHLQRKFSARTAAIILGVLWACWHLPAFFFRDTYMEMGLWIGFPMLLVSVIFASILLTWLYNSTRGSLLMVVVFHALFNWLSVSEAGGDYVAIIMGAAAVFWGVRAIKLHGPENLSPLEKQVA